MIRKSFIIALLTAAAAGCASEQVSEGGAAPAGAQAAPTTQGAGGAQASAAGQGGSVQSGSEQMARTESGVSGMGSQSAGAGAPSTAAPSAVRSVYYDFDKSLVTDEFRSVIESHGAYLAGNPGAKVKIEGNCDERGSREYNLALGQRRADSVRAKLKLLGVGEAQIETVSWGKEKPKAKGHNEAAWSENRRSDIVYTSTK